MKGSLYISVSTFTQENVKIIAFQKVSLAMLKREQRVTGFFNLNPPKSALAKTIFMASLGSSSFEIKFDKCLGGGGGIAQR